MHNFNEIRIMGRKFNVSGILFFAEEIDPVTQDLPNKYVMAITYANHPDLSKFANTFRERDNLIWPDMYKITLSKNGGIVFLHHGVVSTVQNSFEIAFYDIRKYIKMVRGE